MQELIDFSTGTSRSIPEAAAGAAQSEATPVWMLDEQQEQQFEEAEEGEEEEEGYEADSQPAAAAARSRRQVRGTRNDAVRLYTCKLPGLSAEHDTASAWSERCLWM